MKVTLIRFAKDFTKLSEYFGPDDYDGNLIEMNNNSRNQYSNFKREEKIMDNTVDDKINNNLSKKFIYIFI